MVSAIVLGYNRCSEVLLTIEKLKELSPALPFALEIIVVDNESVDDTSEKVKQLHQDVVLVRKEKNNGIAGWNEGFKLASQKYLLVLDDDSHPEWGIPEAVSYMEQNPDTGILALNITSGPYLTDKWIWKNGMPWQHEEEIIGFFGCGALIRKEVYEKIGGFGEWMLVYGHEWDYALRCIDAGFKVRYFKDSSVNHRASSVNRSLKRARIFGTRNDMGLAYKYFGDKKWKYILRIFFNNFKRVKTESAVTIWYDLLGTIEFLKFRKTLSSEPVSAKTRDFFVKNYMNTTPFFSFLKRRFKRESTSS